MNFRTFSIFKYKEVASLLFMLVNGKKAQDINDAF